MVRSPDFGSGALDWYRTFRTRFRFGFGLLILNLAAYANSPGHYAKGTPSPHIYGAPTAGRYTVSGSISLP